MELQLNTHVVCPIEDHAKTMREKTQIAVDSKVSASGVNPAPTTFPLTTNCHQIYTTSLFSFLVSRCFSRWSMTWPMGSWEVKEESTIVDHQVYSIHYVAMGLNTGIRQVFLPRYRHHWTDVLGLKIVAYDNQVTSYRLFNRDSLYRE